MADDSVALGAADYLANPDAPVAPTLRDALDYGVRQNPDQAAQAAVNARELNLPLSVAVANHQEVQARAQVQRIDPTHLMLETPRTAGWMGQSPIHAAMAHDDIPVLQQIEHGLSNLGGALEGGALGAGAQGLGIVQGINEFLDPFGDMGLAVRRTVDPKTGQVANVTDAKGNVTGSPGAVGLIQFRKSLEDAAKKATPQTGNRYLDDLYSGVSNIVQNAPSFVAALATGNPEVALAGGAGLQAGASYTEARDQGKTPAAAAAHGLEQGEFEGLGEKLPLEKLFGDLHAGTPLVKTWFHQLITEIPSEMATTLAQNFTDWVDLHPEQTAKDWVHQLGDDEVQTAISTAVMATGSAVFGKIVHAALTHGDRSAAKAQAAQAAQEQHDQIDGLVKAAEASKLRERDTTTFKDFLDAASKDAPVQSVYINAHDLVDVLGQGDPAKVNEALGVVGSMPSVAPQLDDALKSGGQVEIPVSELLAYAPGTPVAKALMEHLKTDPQGFSPKEAQEFLQTHGENLKGEVEKIVADKGLGEEFQASADAVHAQVKAQLDQTGRYTSDVNDVLARLPARYFAAMGERTNTLPHELFAQHELRTQAQGVTDGSLTDTGVSPKSIHHTITAQVADAYRQANGLTEGAHDVKVAPDPDTMKQIADAFERAQHAPNDPATAKAYEALASETLKQFDYLGHLKIEPGPKYASSKHMVEDVLNHNHLYYEPTTEETFGEDGKLDHSNPMLRETNLADITGRRLRVNDAFRIVHDFFGHTQGRENFGPVGELNAFFEHASMYSKEALPALAAETLMQNAWVNYGPHMRREDGSVPQQGEADYVPIPERRFADQKSFAAPERVTNLAFALRDAERRRAAADAHQAAIAASYRRYRESQGHSGDVRRIAPIPDAHGAVTLNHWSKRRGLKRLDPRHWGDNYEFLTREERQTIGDAPNRTYYGLDIGHPWGYERESGVGDHRYQASIQADQLYDFDKDPDGLTAKAEEKAAANEDDPHSSYFEQAIQEAGYKGYWRYRPDMGLVAAVYEPLKATYQGAEDVLHQEGHYGEPPAYEPGLGFQSTLFNTVLQSQQAKASADQWLATLQKTPGVKKEELEWIGLPEALKLMGEQGAVPREQVLTYIAQNGVRLEEVVQSSELDDAEVEALARDLENEAWERSDFEAPYYVEEIEDEDGEGNPVTRWAVNGSSYTEDQHDTEEEAQEAADEANLEAEREWIAEQDFMGEARQQLENGGEGRAQYADYQAIPGGENYREVLLTMPTAGGDRGHPMDRQNPRLTRDFTSGMGHWDHDNVLAHTRLADFTTPDGKRVLGVLEIQSDWHQKGRDKGYAAPASQAEQDAAADAWDKARTTEEETGRALADVVEPLLKGRLEELLAQKEAADAAYLAFVQERVEPGKAISVGNRWAGAPELEGEWNRLDRARESASGMVFKVQNNIKALETAYDRERGATAAGMVGREIWHGLGEHLDHQFMQAQKLAHDLRQARLAASEARQRVDQVAGHSGIPDAPFKASWPTLVMKRIIKEAVENGYDHVAWSTGEQQADLYDMRQHIGAMRLVHNHDGTRTFVADDMHGGRALTEPEVSNERIVELVGAEMAARLHAAPRETNSQGFEQQKLSDLDLTTGGEGHKAFYDKMLVSKTNDIIKPFGAKVGVVELRTSEGRRVEPLTATERAALEEAQRPETPAPRTPHDIKAEAAEIVRADPSIAQHLEPNGTYAHPRLEELRNELRLSHALIRHAELQEAALKQWGFPITDKMRAENKAVQPPLFQNGEERQPKGSYNPVSNTITLLRNADLSTYLHELGHYFLETTARIAAREDAPADLKSDWDKAATFMGFGSIDPAAWLNLPLDARREGHEKWARGFEAYLREGRAPSVQLKGPFQRFKAWLVHVYADFKQLNVELTPEVRGVFDRLLATKEEIVHTQDTRGFQPIFETKPEGMSDVEWEAYQRLGAEATADAEDQLGARSIRDMRWLQSTRARMIRELTREAAEKRKAVRAEVQGEVAQQPVYRAMEFLKRGLSDGEDIGPHKLSLPELRKMYGEAPTGLEETTGQKALKVDYRKLGYGKYGMLAEEGLSPDHVAELFGFTSGDHLVRALLDAEPMKSVVDGMADQRMLERYGDLSDEQAIAQAADEAIHNDARLRFVATEANALAKAAGKAKIMAEAARDFARDMVSRTRIRDLKPAKYTGAESRAARASAKAAAKGDLVEAAMEKRNQLINGYAAKAAFNAQQEVQKALRLFERLQGDGARKSIDVTYRDQIDQLLERFDLRKGESLKAIDKRASLVKWAEQMKANHIEPAIPDELLNEAYRQHYRNLTLDELRGLVDTVRTIAHLGRLKTRLLTAARDRDFARVVEGATHQVEQNAIGKPRTKRESNQVGDQVERGLRGWFVIARKFDSLINRLAGFGTSGPLYDALVRPKNAASDREEAMKDANARALAKVFEPIAADRLRQKVFIPEIGQSLSLEGRLAVLLNWGNETNRKRVLDGDQWNEQQVEAVLRTLEPRHFTFAQALWDHVNSFRPALEAKELRVYGVVPPMEEASPFAAPDGTELRGGYYPIAYDPDKSAKAADFDAIRMAKAAIIGASRGYVKPGFLKARAEEVTGRPIKLRLGVVFQHLNDVIHDLSWHEYLIDARRLLGNDTLANSIRVHAGPEILAELKRSVDAMETGDAPAQNGFESSVNYLRSGATTAGLAWNFLTALQQPFGLLNGTARIGPKWMGMAFKQFVGDAATLQNTMSLIHGKSAFMRLRADGTTLSREIHDVRSGAKTQFTNDLLKSIMPGQAAVVASKGMSAVEGSFYHFIGKMQMVADGPTWLGQYLKSLDANPEDEAYAIAQADQAVRDSQGAGQVGDLSTIQRGGPLAKLWTNFYSYFNVVYNQLAESVEETQLKGVSNVPALAADIALIWLLPSLFGTMLKKLLTGDDWDDWAADLAKGLLGDMFGLMVGLRDIGAAVMDGKDAPAGLRILQTTGALATAVKKGETDNVTFWKNLNTEGGILFHYPAAQIQRTVLGLQALADGRSHNPAAILAGPAPAKR